MAARKPIRERFNEKWQFIAPTGCWEWTGSLTGKGGYGQFEVDKRRVLGHRLSWELHYGEIPEGLFVLHTCDNPKCCNPEHLFIGTHVDNMRDKMEKGRHVAVRGEENARSKLTEADATAIREVYRRHPPKFGRGSNGLLQFLADWFGVSKSLISLIGRKKTWRHI